MTKRSSLYAIAVWLLCGASAYADPVTVPITSGFLSYGIYNEADLRVQFPNGSAEIEWSDGLAGDWPPDFYDECCIPGTPLNVSTDESFPDPLGVHFGQLRFGSDIYSVTSFNFSVEALAAIIVPSLERGERETFEVPFRFRGTVFGTDADQRTLLLDLVGVGHTQTILDGASLLYAGYNFETNTPSPVPEPGTWLLVATGLGAVIRRMGKNRQE